jgi:hypothetical protein
MQATLLKIYDESITKVGQDKHRIVVPREEFQNAAWAHDNDADPSDFVQTLDKGSLFVFDYPIILNPADKLKLLPIEKLDVHFATVSNFDWASYKKGEIPEVDFMFVCDWYLFPTLTQTLDENRIIKFTSMIEGFSYTAPLDYKALFDYCLQKFRECQEKIKQEEVQIKTKIKMQATTEKLEALAAVDSSNNNNKSTETPLKNGSNLFSEEETKNAKTYATKPVEILVSSHDLTMEDYLRNMKNIMGEKFSYIIPLLKLDQNEARELYQFNEQYGIVDNILGNVDDAKNAYLKLVKNEEKAFDTKLVEYHPVSSEQVKDLKEESGVDSPAARMQAAAVDHELVMPLSDMPNYGESSVFVNLFEENIENDEVYIVAPSKNMAGYGISSDDLYEKFKSHLVSNAPARVTELKANKFVRTRKFDNFDAMDAVAACNLITYTDCKSKVGFNFNTFGANILNPTTDIHWAILPPLIVYYSRGLPALYKLGHAYKDPNFKRKFDDRFGKYLASASDNESPMVLEGKEIKTLWKDKTDQFTSMFALKNNSVSLITLRTNKRLDDKPDIWKEFYDAVVQLKLDYDKIASSDRASFLALLAQVSIFPSHSFMYRIHYDHIFRGLRVMVFSAADYMRVGKVFRGDQFYRPKVYEDETRKISVNQDVWNWYDATVNEGSPEAVLDFRCELLVEKIYPGQYTEREGKKVSGEEKTLLYIDQLQEDKREKAWVEVTERIDTYIKNGMKLVGVVIPVEKLLTLCSKYNVISILQGPLPCLLSVAVVISSVKGTTANSSHVARYGGYLQIRVRRMVFMFQYARYGYVELFKQQMAVHKANNNVKAIFRSWLTMMKDRYTETGTVKTGVRIKRSYAKLLSKEASAQKVANLLNVAKRSKDLMNKKFWDEE